LTAITLVQLGRKEEARNLFTASQNKMISLAKGLVCFSLGDGDKAFEWFDKSYQEGDFWLASLKVDPLWEPLKADPRFQKIVARMNFPK
jgi:hypothetical protein